MKINGKSSGILWGTFTCLLVISLTIAGVRYPTFAILFLVLVVGGAILASIEDWWRRAYLLTLLSMVAGVSSIASIAAIASLAKIGAVVFLAFVTFAESRGKERFFANGSHKTVVISLWIVAGFAMLSIFWSQSRIETLTDGGIVLVLVFILHYTSTTRWQNRSTLVGDMGIIYWTTTILLLVGTLLGLAGLLDAMGGNGRLQGLFPNPNLLGLVAVVSLAIGVGVAAERRNALVWLSLLIPASNIILSQSRTAIIAVIVGILWALLRGNLMRIVPIALVTSLLVVCVQIIGVAVFEDVLNRFTAMEGGDLLNTRTNAWADVIWNIQEHPMGVGWAATRKAMEELYLAGYTESGMFTMHNSWFQAFNELGWIGLPAIAFLAFATLRAAVMADPRGLGLGMVAATVAGSLTHFTESAMFGIGGPYPYLFWFAVLASVARFDIKRDEEKTVIISTEKVVNIRGHKGQ